MKTFALSLCLALFALPMSAHAGCGSGYYYSGCSSPCYSSSYCGSSYCAPSYCAPSYCAPSWCYYPEEVHGNTIWPAGYYASINGCWHLKGYGPFHGYPIATAQLIVGGGVPPTIIQGAQPGTFVTVGQAPTVQGQVGVVPGAAWGYNTPVGGYAAPAPGYGTATPGYGAAPAQQSSGGLSQQQLQALAELANLYMMQRAKMAAPQGPASAVPSKVPEDDK